MQNTGAIMNCPVCRTKTKSFTGKHGHCIFFECQSCGLIFRAEKDILSPEQEKERYDLHRNSFEDEGYVNYLKNFVNSAVVPFAPPAKKGLDYGCGPEPVLARLLEQDYGYKMNIYDPFYAPSPVCRENRYDLITCTEVAEHVKRPPELFEILAARLAPGGILSIMTMFHSNNREHFLDWFYSRDPTHVSFYTPEAMRRLAALFGLKIVYCNQINHITLTTI